MRFPFILFLPFLLIACQPQADKKASPQEPTETVPLTELADTAWEDEFVQHLRSVKEYTQNRDLDGDGQPDGISFAYSGGAHCCYKLEIQLSSQEAPLNYPFEMDGGYEFGIPDGSSPQFRIADLDKDGLDEIFMQIQTYNGEKSPIPAAWTAQYGITQNEIWFDYRNGTMEVQDYTEAP